MIVKGHKLFHDDGTPVAFKRSPNVSTSSFDPKYLVMHYTAGVKASGAISWLISPASSASAHLVIDRDGTITQLVRFDQKAWHAGRSSWHGLTGMNSHSIGIEMANAGKLVRKGDHWTSWSGAVIPDEEVIVAKHKDESTPTGWHVYPEAQIMAALQAGCALRAKYGFTDVLGHEDIAPGRKTDPGPAFPMGSYQSQVVGRAEEKSENPEFVTMVSLNIRSGPGTNFDKLPGSPLPVDTPLRLIEQDGSWRKVDVLAEIQGDNDLQGWVHGKYISPS
jgi:N-acetylmuramoyl-L-alanine amidase